MVAKKKKPAKKKADTKEQRRAKWSGETKLLGEGKPGEAAIVKADTQVLMSEKQALESEVKIKGYLHAAEQNIIAAAVEVDNFVRAEGYKALGFKGLNDWREAKMNNSTFYNARNAMKLLKAGVPPEKVAAMPLTNINELTRKLPESKWMDDKILTLAAGPVATFAKQVTQRSEELGQHHEDLLPRGFKVPVSLANNWDMALRVAGVVDQCKEFEQKLEVMLATYLNSPSDVADKSRLQLYQENYGG